MGRDHSWKKASALNPSSITQIEIEGFEKWIRIWKWLALFNWWTRCDCCRFVDASGEFVAELYIKKMKKLLDFGRRALFYIRVLSGYEERKIRNHRLQLEQRLRQVLGFYYVFRFISVLNLLFLLNCSEFHLLQSPWVAYNNNCSCILNKGEFFQAFW